MRKPMDFRTHLVCNEDDTTLNYRSSFIIELKTICMVSEAR